MQRLTVKEPDDSMIEVAIEAMKAVIPEDGTDLQCPFQAKQPKEKNSMTLRQVYQKGKVLLERRGLKPLPFDAVCLFQKVFGLDRQQLIIHGTETAADSKADAYWMLCESVPKGRPLQYILGEWPFMDFTLRVGDGVLVPREETELLVYTVAEHIKSAGLARAVAGGPIFAAAAARWRWDCRPCYQG